MKSISKNQNNAFPRGRTNRKLPNFNPTVRSEICSIDGLTDFKVAGFSGSPWCCGSVVLGRLSVPETDELHLSANEVLPGERDELE